MSAQKSISNDEITALQQQLASMRTKLQESVETNAHLRSQLEKLRRKSPNKFCQKCKLEISSTDVVAPSPYSSTNRASRWHRIINQPFSSKRLSHSLSPELDSTAKRVPRPQTSYPIPTSEKRLLIEPKLDWTLKYDVASAIDVIFVLSVDQEKNAMCVKFSPDGKYLAVSAGSFSGTAFIYNVESGHQTCVLRAACGWDKDKVGIGALCFTPDRRSLAVTCTDKCVIRLWRISEKRVRSGYKINPGSVSGPAFATVDISSNGRFLACASVQGIIVWRIRDGSKIFFDTASNLYSSARFSPSGLYLVGLDLQDTLKIWSIRTRRIVAEYSKRSRAQTEGKVRATYHDSLQLWTIHINESAGDEMETMFIGKNGVYNTAVTVSPDGRWALNASRDGKAHIWNLGEGSRHGSLHYNGRGNSIPSLDFSPVGEYFAVAVGHNISIWSSKPRPT